MELKKVFRNSGSAMASMRCVYSALIAAHSCGVVRRVAEAPLHVGDGRVDGRRVELEPLDHVGLAAGPVAVLESLRGAAGDRPELGVVTREGRDDRGGAFRGARVAQRMLRIKASPNSLHFTSFAPSIRRAKS